MKKDHIESKILPPLMIQNCTFTGIKWDEEALLSLQTTIYAIQTTATALLNLTELFKNQNINIECLLKIDQGSTLPQFSSALNINKNDEV